MKSRGSQFLTRIPENPKISTSFAIELRRLVSANHRRAFPLIILQVNPLIGRKHPTGPRGTQDRLNDMNSGSNFTLHGSGQENFRFSIIKEN